MFAVAFLLKQQFDEKLKNTASALSDVMKSQQSFFAADVFLNSSQGIQLRMDSLLSEWREKYPSVQACIRIEYGIPGKAPQKIKGCSLGSADADAIFKNHAFTSTPIRIGEKEIAHIDQAAIRPTTFRDLFPPVLWLTIFLAVLGATFAHRVLVRRVEAQILNPLLDKITEDGRNAAIAETTRMVAHDIRKPFQVMKLALNTLLESKNELVRRVGVQLCTDIEGSVRKVNAMLQDILDTSREMTPQVEKISATKLWKTCVHETLRFYPDIHVKVDYDLRHQKMLMADPEKVSRVFTNLFENAVQAIGTGKDPSGLIRITSQDVPEKSQIQFHISNTGPGISKEDAAQLFSPFFTRKKNGTGLGLSISKKIVNSHGGEITCSSASEEETRFTFTLPSIAAPERVAKEDTPDAGGLEKIRERIVLVFDDEKFVHANWRQYAANHSFVTLAQFTRWEEFVEQNAFSLAQDAVAFVDIHFLNSRHSGIDIAKSLRKLGVKRIYAITNDPEAAKESGLFDAILGKEVPKDFMTLVG
ncbi:MAG: HAMP domain-containing sensor histidine kinase [Bdellovibrionota bacterium]